MYNEHHAKEEEVVEERPTIVHLLESDGVYGAEQVVLNLCLDAGIQTRYRFVVACLQSSSSQDGPLVGTAIEQGLHAIALPIRKTHLPADLAQAWHRLRQLRPALIHTHNYKATTLAGMLSLLGGPPLIATCHLLYEEPDTPVSVRAMLWIEQKVYRHLPVVVTVSEHLRRALVDRGLPPDSVHTIPNGIEPQVANLSDPPSRSAFRLSLGASPEHFVVVNIARLASQKNQAAIIEAARLLRETHPQVRFWIAGDGPLRDSLARQISSGGLHDRVNLLGFRADVPDLLAAADAFLLTSVDEGLPMSLLEAMAGSIPVVATAVGGIPDAILDGHSGLIIEVPTPDQVAGRIALLADSPILGLTLSSAAYETFTRRFSARAMARSYETAYSAVIKA